MNSDSILLFLNNLIPIKKKSKPITKLPRQWSQPEDCQKLQLHVEQTS